MLTYAAEEGESGAGWYLRMLMYADVRRYSEESISLLASVLARPPPACDTLVYPRLYQVEVFAHITCFRVKGLLVQKYKY